MGAAASDLPPLAVYVHVPWCVRKCPYCDFNSHAQAGELPEAAWLARLADDLADDLDETPELAGRTVDSIFFGGGTPSLLSPATLGGALDLLHARLDVDRTAEITLEANPGTTEAARFRGFRSAGFNRLSIGVQSFSDRALAALGRIHDAADARRALAEAAAAGFGRINVDLMHGLPGQTHAEALADLEEGMQRGAGHLSWYQLTIEPNTEFFSRPPLLPLEDILGGIEDAGQAELETAGFARYEVSAWARPGEESRHNLNYWTFGDYLGLGPGAHGKISRTGSARPLAVLRSRRTRAPADWLAKRTGPRARRERIEATALPGEFMLNALRLTNGVDEDLFEARTGLPLERVGPVIAALREEGLLRPDRIATTPMGLRFLDRVVGRFLDA